MPFVVFVDPQFRSPPKLYQQLKRIDPSVSPSDYRSPGGTWEYDDMRDDLRIKLAQQKKKKNQKTPKRSPSRRRSR